MSEFQLEPWEQTIKFYGDAEQPEFENADLHLACVPILSNRWIMFGREKARPETGNWLALLLPLEPRMWAPKIPLWVPQKASEIWSSYPKCRLFSWTDKRCILEENGDGAWLDERLDIEVKFRMNFASDRWNNAASLWNLVQQELARSDSDIAFKFRWQEATYEERQHIYFAGRNVELQDVLLWILIQISARYGSSYLSWSVGLFDADEEMDFECYKSSDQIEEEMKRWNQFFVSDFLPRILKDQFQKYSPLSTTYGFYSSLSAFINHLPSAHEHLEARLLLREWLQQNAPDRLDLLP